MSSRPLSARILGVTASDPAIEHWRTTSDTLSDCLTVLASSFARIDPAASRSALDVIESLVAGRVSQLADERSARVIERRLLAAVAAARAAAGEGCSKSH